MVSSRRLSNIIINNGDRKTLKLDAPDINK
ncbi:hypothetical protein PEPS_37620 (plasmid) [Persicobacter psychrovividus]|uniref:Uncharacterized protein n=1 Tax=Persicobacter psychrovividus TaxID=387638 RepID=A0ABM7VKE5_9BACT|nr:hypothetical protein PEPS_37500 [Persicobacter psychrovividus]BDD01482.1 hypothetical protein PEPS_37620 [Persicobacter psychrovividus]